MRVNLKRLIARLNRETRQALEAAAGLCVSRTHFNIEIEHMLLKLLDSNNSDFAIILMRFEIDRERLTSELTASLDKMKSGGRTPAFGSDLLDVMTDAWLYGSIECDAAMIRTGFVVVAMLTHVAASRTIHEVSPELQKINVERLRHEFPALLRDSPENEPGSPRPPGPENLEAKGGPRVFICYRREDAPIYANLLFIRIRAEVPDVRVFRDEDTLQPGMVFAEKIRETVGICDILLAIIGSRWLGESGGARRIDRPDDWVRLEIATALEQNRRVIPCLVAGAVMPPETDLPADLAGLAARHSVTISENDPGRDVDRLIEQLTRWRRGG